MVCTFQKIGTNNLPRAIGTNNLPQRQFNGSRVQVRLILSIFNNIVAERTGLEHTRPKTASSLYSSCCHASRLVKMSGTIMQCIEPASWQKSVAWLLYRWRKRADIV